MAQTTLEQTPQQTTPEAAAPQPLGRALLGQAAREAFVKLNPWVMRNNPVMFIVELGAFLITAVAAVELITGVAASSGGSPVPLAFSSIIALWLWLTVYFANFAEAIAQGRGKAQSETLKKTRSTTLARVITSQPDLIAGQPITSTLTWENVPSAELAIGNLVDVEAGEIIPGDGEVRWGLASVDESAITGESAPVIREAGTDHSAVTGGTRVLSDRIIVEITAAPGQTFVDKMIRLVEGANRQKTPNEIALSILLASLSIIFMIVVLTLNPLASYDASRVSLAVMVALLVCLIPTTIGALLSAIGIAGMDRLVNANVLAKSGRAVEAAGDVSTLLLDKTGTITHGNRRAYEVVPVPGIDYDELAHACVLASLADPTPEGKSILDLLADYHTADTITQDSIVPFSAATRMSGLDLPSGVSIRKGATSSILKWLDDMESDIEHDMLLALHAEVERVASLGGTPLVVAHNRVGEKPQLLGVIHLKDIVKDGLKERFVELRAMGIKTIMVTGDNATTAAAIAAEAGVDDFIAEATPEDKFEYIKREQEGGRLVAMTGDGTNDAPALAQADVGVAMNSGTSAAKEAGNMVDLDSDPTKLLEIIRIGKQLLITRGALTTFSIANDIAKYFAIVPAMFVGVYPGLEALNVMGLSSPASAVTSAVIFNAIIIVFLVPVALRGASYKPRSASQILAYNLTVYGLGGLIAPFIGIKIIDLAVSCIPGF
ncbi:potassium-transporting ATPase subunit KdpB [Timonella sp. A28]|uniref:potassium-transporting ATPase subunit KdpB n=1 Tax=Timonella sp. A28 TaxID=3442640 RepID=UPI003EBFF819